MRAIVVLSFELPDPDAIVEVMKALDPPALPHFAGEARVAIDPVASQVCKWLDDDEPPAD